MTMSTLTFWNRQRSPNHKPILFAFESRTYVWNPGLVQTVMHAQPLFRRVIERCDETIKLLLGWSLVQELGRPFETSRYNSTEELFEPTLAAVSIAQVEVWRQRGVTPAAVMGLSGGEFTAAYTAGVLNLEETMAVACQFSRVFREKRMKAGKMVLVRADWSQAVRLQHELGLACYLAVEWEPRATIFSGEPHAIDALIAHLDVTGIGYHLLRTDFCYHTALSAEGGRDFVQTLQGLRPQPPTLPIYSTITGGLLTEAAFDAQHWWQMATTPAFAVRTFRTIFEDGYERVLDIGFTSKALFPLAEVAQMVGRRIAVEPSLSCLAQNTMPFTPPAAKFLRERLRVKDPT